MSVFISSIAELSQNFFNSDPLKFNQYFAITPDYQKYCLAANLPTRFTIMLAKEAMLIHDIAINLLAGGYKLTTGTVKCICAIASGVLGLETDHQTPSKQAAIHFGFACFYLVDFFVSITNINKTYPQYLVNKIETIFTDFLKTSNKNVVTRNIIVSDPEIEQELKIARKELEKRNADFDQLAEEIKEIGKDLNKPSYCEKAVDKVLSPNEIILEKVRNITKNNPKQLEKETENTLKKTETKEKKLIHKKDSSSLPKKQLSYDSSQYTLIEIESDDDIDLLNAEEEKENFWIDDELEEIAVVEEKEENLHEKAIIPYQEQSLKEEKGPIKTPEILEIRKETFQKNTSATRKAKMKTPPHNSSPAISTLARRLKYSERIRSRSKKTLAS